MSPLIRRPRDQRVHRLRVSSLTQELSGVATPGPIREAIKPGTERNGTEPEVIDAQYGRGDWTRGQKLALIGASLSEPHTSGTALRKCVNVRTYIRPCLLAAIYRKF